MKCPRCGTENRSTSKFCNQCGGVLGVGPVSAIPRRAPAPPARPDVVTPFWKPTWRWHLTALGFIYAGLVVVFFLLSQFLSRVPQPFRMRDIPKEMTPWLKR